MKAYFRGFKFRRRVRGLSVCWRDNSSEGGGGVGGFVEFPAVSMT